MSSLSFRSSRPDGWNSPRQPLDANQRRLAHGKILPMEQPGLLSRLLRQR
ncbi:MAG: hypothetical protein P0Y56_12755 [Candidatus Andeanibacterium colombiense]|uniref:Uncharacterized protein n=1 Tax=Candidatus Andeanibacterium colombiense TaxID=3121345 RepID=A0AAJ5X883_9SPHN|nr:MAG: hypothetical protein P0Y56_12755 [Sphingomonadaceae bacterium]